MMKRLLAVLILAGTGCGESTESRTTWAGYWEGKGTTRSTPMKDNFKTLTRDADYEFWFTVDPDGRAVGEVELLYNSELRVENLPSVNVGVASFAPSVGGKITDLNPKRKFPLIGFTDGQKLALAIATPEEAREKLKFTMRADSGVSGSMGGVSMSGAAAGVGSVQIMEIPMTPFSPFTEPGTVTKRPGGPYAANYEERAENLAIEWSARQAGGEQRDVRLTPEMEAALRDLRQRTGL